MSKLNYIEFILSRRTVRTFSPRSVEKEKIMTLIELAHNAPSAGNLQPWRFIIVEDPAIQEALMEVSYEQEWIYNAPALVAVIADIERCKLQYGDRGYLYAIMSTSAAIENFLLGAHALGLSGVWVSGFIQKEVDSILNVPSGFMTLALIPIGYPKKEPEPKGMADIYSRVYYNKFGIKWEYPWRVLREYRVGAELIKKKSKRFFSILKSSGEIREEYAEFINALNNIREKEKVYRLGLKREPGYLYFTDKDGDISRIKAKKIKKGEQNESGRKK